MASENRTQGSLRVGVLGAARVLHKSWLAIHTAGHVVRYVGCRSPERAEALVKEIAGKLPGGVSVMPYIGSYMDVVSSPEVDVVYITVPVTARDELVRACVQHGKHIVGEKPAAESVAQLHAWLEATAAHRLLYMDGTMLSHGLRATKVREVVQKLGKVKHIDARFTFMVTDDFLQHDIRVQPALEPHGALGDLGWYCIRWILHIMDFAVPTAVSGRITESTAPSQAGIGGAILGFEGNMRFGGDQSGKESGGEDNDGVGTDSPTTATFYCSFTEARQQTLKIIAVGGVVTVESAINPAQQTPPYFCVEYNKWAGDDAGVRVQHSEEVIHCPPENEPSYQATQLWRDVADALLPRARGEVATDVDKAAYWSRQTYLTQALMDRLLDAARESARNGVTQPVNSNDNENVDTTRKSEVAAEQDI